MDIKKTNEILEALITEFEDVYEKTIEDVKIDGSRLKEALANQIELMIKWETLLARAKTLVSIAEDGTENSYSDAITAVLQDSFKKYSITEAKEVARCNKTYRSWKKTSIDVNSLYNEIKAILEVVQSRKYILNNITNSVVASQENHII